MNHSQHIQQHYSWILILCIVIGLISGLFLVQQRHSIEQEQSRIENIMDYDAVMRGAAFEKRATDEVLQAVRDSGITAMAIYDRTLEKARDAGEIRVYRSNDFHAGLTMLGGKVKEGALYIAPVSGKDIYFQEIKEDLVHRLGANKVQIRNTSQGPMIELFGAPTEAFLTMKLGISRAQAMEVSQAGFNVIVRPSNFRDETKDDVDYLFSRIQGVPNVTGLIFVGKEVVGYPNNLDSTLEGLHSHHIPVIGIEAVNQLQYDPQAGFNELAVSEDYSVGRVYTIAKDELKKITPAEAAQRFYISDMERNIRFNLFPIYENGVNNQTSLQTSLNYVKVATQKLADKGFTFGRGSVYPAYHPNPLLVVLTMMGAIALFTFVFNLFIPMAHHKQLVIFFGLLFLSVVIYILTTGTFITQIWALSSACLAPTGAIVLLMDWWNRSKREEKCDSTKAMFVTVLYTVIAATLAVIGGIFIAAMLGNTKFFMEFALFRGVKLTFILPILLTIIAYLQRFPLWRGRQLQSPDEALSFVKEFFTLDVKMYVFAIVAVLGAAAYVFIGRSGHTAGVAVPSFELALRRFLENTLYARPREKEFMIGHPFLMLAGFAFLRKWPMLIHFVLTVVGVIGLGSMVETFCHVRTPVYMTLMRGFDGLWIGIVLGLVAILFVRLALYITQWYRQDEVNHE